MLTYDDVSTKCQVVIKSCSAFLKVFQLLSMCAKFQVNQYDTLSFNSLFKHCILQTILHTLIFIVYIFEEQNLLCEKLSRILHLFELVWGGIRF